MTEVIEQPYAGGLNYAAEDLATKEGTVPDAANVHFGLGGRVSARGGSVKTVFSLAALSDTTTSGRPVYIVEEDNLSIESVTHLALTGGNVSRFSFVGGVEQLQLAALNAMPSSTSEMYRPVAVAFTDSSSPTTRQRFTVFAYGSGVPKYLPVGSNTVFSVTHADFTATTTYPTTCAAYAGRMFYAGVSAEPARLYYSQVATVGTLAPVDPLNPLSTDGGTIDLQLVDGGRILGLKHLYDILLIFTTRGIYRLVALSTGTIPFKVTQVSTQVATSQHAIVQADNEIYFVARSGVHKLSTALTYGDIKSEEVTVSIAQAFDSAQDWELKGAFGTFNKSTRQIHFFFQTSFLPVGAKPNALPPEYTYAQLAALFTSSQFFPPSVSTCYTLNLRGSSWERHHFPFYIDYAIARDAGDGNVVVDAYTRKDAHTGVVSNTQLTEHTIFENGVVTDAGTAIDAYVRTRKWALDAIGARKARLFLHSYVKTGTPAAAVSFDDAVFTSITPALPTGVSRVAAIGSGHIAQVEYSGGAPWELNAVAPDIKTLGRR